MEISWSIIGVIIIPVTAGFISVFSGFGVSVAMLPVLVVFFPPEIAIALAAVLSVINNIFKLRLFKTLINRQVLLFFGAPAAIMSFIGAEVLLLISETNEIIHYNVLSMHFSTSTLKLFIGFLIIGFVLMEFAHKFKAFYPHKLATVITGSISGFLGGISGYQGGFQASILLKLNMPLRQFITTYAAITLMIDLPRILVYLNFIDHHFSNDVQTWSLGVAAVSCTLLGTYIAYRYTERITVDIIRFLIISITMIVGLGLVLGKV